MSREAIISVQRGSSHTPVSGLQAVPVRLEDISPIVIAGAGGAIPNYSFWLFSRVGVPDIRQGDLLTDIVSAVQYRASGKPMPEDGSYLQIMIEQNLQVGA